MNKTSYEFRGKVKKNQVETDEDGVFYKIPIKYKDGKKGKFDYEAMDLTLSFGMRKDANKFPPGGTVNVTVEVLQQTLDDEAPEQSTLED